ncbi:hypothetical protein FA15DRAFT_697269 [Coprinopsis marcescibilis]|uniref:Uncharacterized protein n=1 Tax=Coprinopsis marcescibilis TaxID=230819 RepID=A0A5C3KI73_COPMA|nr:hypothetical protein FA15DRAFT_697269 [Coprinopsis marcescibilis]
MLTISDGADTGGYKSRELGRKEPKPVLKRAYQNTLEMSRQLFVSLVVALLATQKASAVIPVGGLCVGFAGPVNDTCVEGSICCNVSPDRSLCTVIEGKECPSKFIEEGGFCAGIAGPLKDPCVAGTSCCYVSPDNGVDRVGPQAPSGDDQRSRRLSGKGKGKEGVYAGAWLTGLRRRIMSLDMRVST